MIKEYIKKYWQFDVLLALIVTFVTIGVYLLAYILVQTLFIFYGYNNSIEYNLNNIKITLYILIPTIFFQIILLSLYGKFAEKFEKEETEKEIEEKKKQSEFSQIIDEI